MEPPPLAVLTGRSITRGTRPVIDRPLRVLRSPQAAAGLTVRVNGPGALTDEFFERGCAAYRVEVGVVGGERGALIRTLHSEPEMLDRIGRSSGETLTARHVVEQPVVLGMSLDQLTALVRGLGVLARLIQRAERRPDLHTTGLVCLPRRAAEGDDRRPRLLGERRALYVGPDEDQRADWRLHRLAGELEPCTAGLHEVELFVSVVAALVVLVDDSVARLATDPGVDAERRDAEVVAD